MDKKSRKIENMSNRKQKMGIIQSTAATYKSKGNLRFTDSHC